ncbi:MAG: hypothetical protein ACETVY_02265 [Candidatus Bathyarchaeia archaeon]
MRTPGTTVRMEVYIIVPTKELGMAPLVTSTTDDCRKLVRLLYIRLKKTAADPIARIALLLSTCTISATRLAAIVAICVETAHIQVPKPTLIGMKGINMSAAATINVIRSRVKGIAQSIGGSLTVLTIAAIKKGVPQRE